MKILTQKLIASLLKPRIGDSHKGDYGHALLIAGSKGKMGAALIASKACLRAGAGLLSVLVPAGEAHILQSGIPEAMLYIQSKKEMNTSVFSAVAIGPGLGITGQATNLLRSVLEGYRNPLVIDADALNIISRHKKLLDQLPVNTILTPHTKEFDRLFGEHARREERIITALQKSKEYQIAIVLKGHHTMIIAEGNAYKNTNGNPGLAKGGSGDALTGIICAFLAQGYSSLAAAQLGVYIHGLAADMTLQTQSEESMLISDVIDNLGQAFKKIRQDHHE